MLPDLNAELTDDQIQQLEQARKLIPKLKEQMRRAKLAGIDISAQEAEISALENQLNNLYRVYVKRIGVT